jgi:phosphoribosylanthranilate isomerase
VRELKAERTIVRNGSNHRSHSFPWPPRIQVAGVSSLEEALFCRSVGVDALGFTLSIPSGIHDGLTVGTARVIIEHLPVDIVPVVITYLQSAQQACGLVHEVRGKAVQFHGGIDADELERFRADCPGVKVIGVVTVSGEQVLEQAAEFRPPLWDALLLDSFDPGTGRIGATGITHDWSLSAKIVRNSLVPVILAGGLNPRNVAKAIFTVRPHGVDTHTGVENLDGSRSFEKIRMFATAALDALESIGRR